MRHGVTTTQNKWLQLPEQLVATYNSWDVYNTAQLVSKTTNLLRTSGNETFFRTEFWPLVPVVGAMQARGVGELDREARNKYRSQLRSEISQLEKQILVGTTGTYTDKLFNSPKQLAELLYGEWSLPKPPLGRNRTTPSTDLQALAWTLAHFRKRDEPHREQLHKLFHRSRLQTILERYLVVEGDDDGRVRPTIKITGTETGRFAYAGGPGEAIQQWPHEARHLIRAKPGHVFVARDYSQLEARILAVLSQDKLSLDAFRQHRDIHIQNCCDLFGFDDTGFLSLPPTNRAAFRNFAKTFLYGLSYGAKSDSIKMKLFCPCSVCAPKAPPQVNLDRAAIKAAASRWEQAHPAIMDFRSHLVESVYGYGQDRTWTSPFGWRRRLWEPQDQGERSLLNLPMQHCASVIINRAMRQLHEFGVPLVLQMHDELVAEVPTDEAERTLELMRVVMEASVPELDNTVFPTSGATGQTWADLK